MKAKDKKRIFSGKQSKELWKYINKIKKGKPGDIFWAVYILGYRCQELESEVEKLKAKVISNGK